MIGGRSTPGETGTSAEVSGEGFEPPRTGFKPPLYLLPSAGRFTSMTGTGLRAPHFPPPGQELPRSGRTRARPIELPRYVRGMKKTSPLNPPAKRSAKVTELPELMPTNRPSPRPGHSHPDHGPVVLLRGRRRRRITPPSCRRPGLHVELISTPIPPARRHRVVVAAALAAGRSLQPRAVRSYDVSSPAGRDTRHAAGGTTRPALAGPASTPSPRGAVVSHALLTSACTARTMDDSVRVRGDQGRKNRGRTDHQDDTSHGDLLIGNRTQPISRSYVTGTRTPTLTSCWREMLGLIVKRSASPRLRSEHPTASRKRYAPP